MSSLIETKVAVNHALSNTSQAMKTSEIVYIVQEAIEHNQLNSNGNGERKENQNSIKIGNDTHNDMRAITGEYLRLRKKQEFIKLIKNLKRVEDIKKYENTTSLDHKRHEQDLRALKPVSDDEMRQLGSLQDSIQINCEKIYSAKERIRMKKLSLTKSLANIQQTLSSDDSYNELGLDGLSIFNGMNENDKLENLPQIKEKDREINQAKAALTALENRAKTMEASIKANELESIKIENDLSVLRDTMNQVQQKEGSTRDHLVMMKEKADELRKTIQILGGLP